MEVRSIANILKDVPFRGEGRLTNPRAAFSTHVSVGFSFSVHEYGHGVTTDARKRPAAFWYLGRTIVRTARAKPISALWRSGG